MATKPVYLPPEDKAALEQTAARMGGQELDQVIDAAVWAFLHQPPVVKRLLVAEFWFHGVDAFPKAKPRKTMKEYLYGLANRFATIVRQFGP